MTRTENLLRTIRRNDPAWVPYRFDGSITLLRPPLCVWPADGGTDVWGAHWLASPDPDEGSVPSSRPAIYLVDIELFRAPDTDWSLVTSHLRRLIDANAGEDTLNIGYLELALFDRAQALLTVEELLAAVASEPELLEILLDTIADYQVGLVEAMMEAGVAGVRFTDDWGMQSSLFISPAQWRRLLKPRLARMYQAVKGRGGLVFQHSCGHIDEIVPDLIELGLDVLDPCQPASNDILSWKKRFGNRLCFMGGLDTQTYLSFGTPNDVRREVLKVLATMARGGGYIAAPSHRIRIPEANKRAMMEALQAFTAS